MVLIAIANVALCSATLVAARSKNPRRSLGFVIVLSLLLGSAGAGLTYVLGDGQLRGESVDASQQAFVLDPSASNHQMRSPFPFLAFLAPACLAIGLFLRIARSDQNDAG